MLGLGVFLRKPGVVLRRNVFSEWFVIEQGNVGVVVGAIEPGGRRIVASGTFDKDDPRPVDGNTIFEIGSISKVFTPLMLADMIRRGEVARADPVATHLPKWVKAPERGGRGITLEDLARHRSGLPRDMVCRGVSLGDLEEEIRWRLHTMKMGPNQMFKEVG